MKRTFLFLMTYTAICISVVAQCPDKKCSDTFAEWGFEMQIVDDAYIPVITNTDEDCYITLQSEIPKLNSILAKYNIVNFYRYIDTLHVGDPLVDQAYILVCDEGQFELGEELRDSFPNAIPYVGHWECFAQLTNSTSNIFSKNSSWTIVTTNMFDDTFSEISTYKVDSDTLIGDKSYSKLLRNNSFYSALRETEENEIYAYFSDLERELLIYDFDWHPNKTLYCETSYEDNVVQAVLGNNIDSIQLLDGKYYKCVRNHAGELSLIRGIGDIRGFFISTFDLPTDGSQYALLSFYIDDMLVYSISDLNYYNTNDSFITGVLTTRALPCFTEDCPCMDVVAVSNDTASFVLSQRGQYLGSFSELGDFSFGDIISIYGSISQKQEYNGQYVNELLVKAILKDMPQSHFSANCIGEIGDENQSTPPVLTVENDSVIIKYIQYEQCCSEFALNVSDPVNDTVYIHFADTAREQCDCMCNYEVRISLEKPELPMSYFCMLNYSTYNLDLNDSIFNQQYKSIFSKDTTQWNVFECAADAGGTIAYYSFSDTIINNKNYNVIYKEKLYTQPQVLGNDSYISGYIREDTINGKWWSLKSSTNQYQEVLLMDLELQMGDYFQFINNFQQADSAIVDTVYYQNRRKIIEVNKLHSDCRDVYKTLFIEGIGPTCGFEFEGVGMFSLVCKFENKNHVFSTQSDYNGNCFREGGSDVKSIKREDLISLYPNPADDILTVYSSNTTISKIEIFAISGEKIHSQVYKNNIDVSSLTKGLYILKVYDINEQAAMFKFIKK